MRCLMGMVLNFKHLILLVVVFMMMMTTTKMKIQLDLILIYLRANLISQRPITKLARVK
jgi:hypothetical protein